MDSRLSGRNTLAYQGVLPESPPNLRIEKRDPTTRDSANFVIGAIWVTMIDRKVPATAIWMLIGLNQNIATWIKLWPEITPGAINFVTDTGIATIIGGIVNVVGGDDIATSGAGNTITIDVDGDFITNVITQSGIAIPSGGSLGILGGNNINTSASGINVIVSVNENFVVPLTGSITFADPTFSLGVVQTDVNGTLFSDNGQDGQFILGGGTTGVAPQWTYLTTNTPASLDITSGIVLGAPFLNIDFLGGVFASAFRTDTGIGFDAVPDAGLINILGTANEITTASPGAPPGNTITIALSPTLVIPGTITVPGLVGPGFVRTDAAGLFSVLSDSVVNGQVIISSAAGLPIWAGLTAGANITITPGPNSIQISATGGGGGGGIVIVHTNAGDANINLGDDSVTIVGVGNMNVTGDGVNTATITIANSPTFTGTVTAGTGFVATTGDITAVAGDVVITLGDLNITAGTINLASLTEGVMYLDGTNAVTTIPNGNDGQVLIGATGAPPAWANITSAGATIAISNGPNTINIEATGVAGLTILGTDTGDALPLAGRITVAGGPNINTDNTTPNTVTVNLDTSIIQPNTNASGTQGLYSLGANRFMHNFSTDGSNTFLGGEAGNLTLTTAQLNVGIGAGVLTSLTTGDNNVSLGGGPNLTSGANNTLLGVGAGNFLITGSSNFIGGFGAGLNYTGAQSSNIVILNDGDALDSNVIRIGTEGLGVGQQIACYIAGIFGHNVNNPNTVVFIDSLGKLGTPAGGTVNGNILIGGTNGPLWTSLTAGSGIAIVPGDHTITITATGGGGGGGATDFITQSGTAIVNAGVIQIIGGENINTTGATNVVTVNLNHSIAWPSTAVNGGTPGGFDGLIRINSQFFMHARGSRNTFLGLSAGNMTLTTGSATDNTGLGANVLTSLTTGANNTVAGSGAGQAISTGNENCLFGQNAGALITTSSSCVAVGRNALGTHQTGDIQAVAVGHRALQSNGNGALNNTAVGYRSGANITGADDCTLVGHNAGTLLTVAAAAGSTAIGSEALASATSDARNTGVGFHAGWLLAGGASNDNTSVGYNAAEGLAANCLRNTSVGSGSMFSGGVGRNGCNDNTGVGFETILAGISLSSFNTALGSGAGRASQQDNTCIGYNAGRLSINRNVIIGSTAGDTASGISDAIIIGYNAGSTYTGNSSGSIIIGNTGVGATELGITRIGNTPTGFGSVACYIGGIYNKAVAAAPNNHLVSVDNTGKLGLAPIQLNTIPAFFAQQSSNFPNATGDDFVYTVGTGVAFNEIFDAQGNLTVNANNLRFTAPVTGKYWIELLIQASNLPVPPPPPAPTFAPSCPMDIVTSNRTYIMEPLFMGTAASTTQSYGFNVFADMDAGDTCVWRWSLLTNIGTRTVGCGAQTFVAGFLVYRS